MKIKLKFETICTCGNVVHAGREKFIIPPNKSVEDYCFYCGGKTEEELGQEREENGTR